MITQAAGRLHYYNLYRYRSWICGWRAICLKHIEARRRDLQARKCLGWIKLESITFKVGIYQNQPNGPSGGFRTTPRALAKFGRPKNACVFEGGRIWLSPRKRAVAAATARFLPLNRSIDFNVHQYFWCFTFFFTTAKSVTSECAGETRGGPEVGRRSAYAPVVRWPPRAVWKNNSALILFSSLADMI